MSRRRRRRAGRAAPRPSTSRAADLAVLALFTGVGAGLGGATGGHFATPQPIDRDTWHVVSPGLDARVLDPALGRGVYVEDGALTLRQHAFHRAEILSLHDPAEVRQVAIELEAGVVRLNFPGPTGMTYATLGPDTAADPRDARATLHRPEGTPWVAEVAGDTVVLHTTSGPRPLGPASGGSIELTAVSEEVRIPRLRVTARDGTLLLDEDHAATASPAAHWGLGALLGLLVGLAGRLATRTRPPSLAALELAVLAGLPLAVCVVPLGDWLYLVERAYLVRTPAWGLARWALALALLPTFALALLRSGVLVPPETRHRIDGRRLWVGGCTLAALSAAVQGGPHLSTLAITAVGLAVMLLPLRIVREAQLPPVGAALVDLPAQVAVGVLGWGAGLGVLVGWRLLTTLAGAGAGVLRAAPRPVTDHLFALLLVAPVALELAVRDTYLAEGWDLSRLSGDLAPSVGWQDPAPFWKGSCTGGDGAPTRTLRVLWMGGSSTGGAYQFRDQPTAFFPAQAHHRLCALAPPGVQIVSENYGDGGRDTFTISRSLPDIAERSPPSLVVVYTGVNDLLTMSGTRTRAQREAAQADRDAATTGLGALSARSRVLTGLGLLLRPLHATEGTRVPEVPLTDAAENFARIAETARDHRAQVLLLTEVIRVDSTDPLAPYAALEAEVATELHGVTHLDLRAQLTAQGPWDDQEMLVDQNHLSRAGSARVAAALTPTLARLLALPAPVEPDLAPVPADRFAPAAPSQRP